MRSGADDVVGRDGEIAHLRRVLDAAATRSQRLLVVGEPGIGKTTLLDRIVSDARAAGHRVLGARPARVERRLPFAVLADLVGAMDLDVVSSGWRQALHVALGRVVTDMPPPPPHHVGMALVELLRHAIADGRRLTIVIDDVQWIDHASRGPLEFALRRLPPAGVTVLLAMRVERDGPAGGGLVPLDEIVRLGPLPPEATEVLVRSAVPAGLSPHAIARIADTAQGNPMFAIEFARSANDSLAEPGRPLPVPPSLASITASRLASLPEATRQALALVSMLARPTVDTLTELGILDHVRAAEVAGVIMLNNRTIRFTHPVLAAAAYDATTGTDRIVLHRRLAGVTHGTEQLIHRALAATSIDGALADELVAAAWRENARGATHEAADIGALALGLGDPEDAGHWRRAVSIGELFFRSGRTDESCVLLEQVEQRTTDADVRSKALLVLATIEYSRSADSEVAAGWARSCLSIATDVTTRIEAHAILARCDYLDFADAVRHAEAALHLLAEQPTTDRALHASVLTAAAAARFSAGLGLDRHGLDRAIELERDAHGIGADSAFATLAALLKYTDDIDTSIEMFDRLAADTDPASVPYALGHLPQLHVWRGDLDAAASTAARGRRLALEAQQGWQVETADFNLALVDAMRGRFAPARDTAHRLADVGRAGGVPWTERMGEALLGLVAMCCDDLDGAVRHFVRYDELGEQMRLHEPGYHRLFGDYIEALVLAGERSRADEAIERVGARADRTGRVSAQSMVARGQALCAMRDDDLDVAVAHARRAVDLLAPTALAYEVARARLVLGSVARRAQQRSLARDALDRAIATFDMMSAQPFADRARHERQRISGRARRDDDPASLTAAEAAVASLAAAGRTTRQIADTMHVSAKTVESHLTRVYRKLGVANRAQLATRLASSRPAPD